VQQRTVYTIGESIFDIMFKANDPVAARVGGGMLNTAVSLGRLNTPVFLISEYGYDKLGDISEEFLINNGVRIDFIKRYKDGKTPVSIALLDENNNAEYSFYKIYPEQRLNIPIPEIKHDDIVIFGSFYSVTREIRQTIVNIITKANQNKAIILYDPNFRKSHLSQLNEVMPLIYENISFADIIHCSDEDFSLIFNIKNANDAYKIIKKAGCSNLIYTANKKGVTLKTLNLKKSYAVPQISPISTIGAGDSFNAGIIYALLMNNITHENISNITPKQWDSIIKSGIATATHVCMNFDNYISQDFAKIHKQTFI